MNSREFDEKYKTADFHQYMCNRLLVVLGLGDAFFDTLCLL